MLFPEAPQVQRWGLGLPYPRLVLKNDEKEEEMASSFLFAKHSFSGPLFLGGAFSPLLPLALCSLSCGHLQEGCSACSVPCRVPAPCVLWEPPATSQVLVSRGGERDRRLPFGGRTRRLVGPHRVWCSLEEHRSHHDHRVEALPQGPHPVLPAASSVRITPSLHRGTFAAPPPPLELQARIGTGTPLESA